MKKLLFFLLFMMTTLLISAVPARRGQWKKVRLADGREIRVELVGDEFGHYWRATDGLGYMKRHGEDVYDQIDVAALERHTSRQRCVTNSRRVAAGGPRHLQIGGDHTPFVGIKRGLIILVEFADKKFAEGHDRELYERIANEEGFKSSEGFVGSVRDYFKSQSGGEFTLDFDVVGPFTMPNGYAYYGKNNANRNDIHVGEMVADACVQADADVNFADYDWDGDNVVDQVFILYAGRGEASGGGDTTIWPHESQLRYSDYGKALLLDGVYINTYACSNEMQTDTKIDGIGTICHEFSHCMGLPDMYDTSYSGNFGMSVWDVMDQGSYLRESFVPCSYTSYERMYCGWQQPVELTAGMEVKDMKALSEGGETYIMYNEANRNEYYLLENRQRTGWDAGLFGSGLLILHVDFDSKVWAYNSVNTTSNGGVNNHQRCTIFHADDSDEESALSFVGDPYPRYFNNCLTPTSKPASGLFNRNVDGTKMMDKSLLNITRNGDGTIAFTVRGNAEPHPNRPEGAVFYESFDICSGRGGNDGVWRSAALGTAPFVPDNIGWTSEVCYGGSQCARFGDTGKNGAAVTPEFTIAGETVLTFRAAPCVGDGNELTLTVNSGDAALSDNVFTMESGRWSDFSTTITGNGPVRIAFSTSLNRLYLDEIAAVPSALSAIGAVRSVPAVPADARIYSLDGRCLGTDASVLPKGIYVKEGRKFVK